MPDRVERFVYDLGGWPTPEVERRRTERLRALIAEAVAAERERIREALNPLHEKHRHPAAVIVLSAVLDIIAEAYREDTDAS